MKTQIISLICCVGILTSCNSFLDREPFMRFSREMALTNAEMANYALLGVYDRLQSSSAYGREIIAIADACTDNNVLSPLNSGRFVAISQWTVTPNTSEPSSVWSQVYLSINSANEILAKIDDQIEATDAQRALIKGEALALRGLLHFELVRYFAQSYVGNESSMGIPYIETPHIYDLPSRDDVKTVYSKIIADLTNAIALLTTTNSASYAPYRIDHWAAKAILARVYMAQLDYAKAKPLLADIITNSGYQILSNANYKGAWAKRYNAAAKTEFMFAISFWDGTDYGATGSLGYIYLQIGYGDLRVPPAMRNLYDNSDVRKSTFFEDGTGAREGWIMVCKYPSRDGTNGLSDIPIVRVSDVYLMYAEACAYTGDESTAITYLDRIRLRAQPTAEPSTETGDVLKEKIFLERRKELAYEGFYYHDLKRYHRTINSAYDAFGNLYSVITYPSPKLAYPIPQNEMDVNTNMVQNPSY